MSRPMDPVTVIGLNPRGMALARVLAADARVTVWDESAPGTSPGEGLQPAESLRAALTDASLVLMCVDDYDASQRILTQAEPHLAADVVNLTSGTSAQAEQAAAGTRARYLDGALMGHPEHVGAPETVLVYSGSAEAFEHHRAVLDRLGGATYLGEAPGTASLYEVAMLNFAWATQLGFLHTAALLGTAQIPATTVAPLLIRWLSATVADVISDQARQIDDRDYPGDQEWLELDAPLMDHLVETSRARGLDTALPELVRALTARGIEAGRGGEGFASLAEIIRA
ncbi:NAD(P)-binding domain-containing protein [Actinomadura sp. NEAU-AAG7]|uniref:NAD(P)-dependent oxidoreductase n=1 Tax=Actinomadura sp. NEAU-AAG7 TaxID=2839640 RepID=UPI0027DF2BB7|nr:NAD(P)-binding domain-containing protein [Actinomadura sp. NEAU-AAG7]